MVSAVAYRLITIGGGGAGYYSNGLGCSFSTYGIGHIGGQGARWYINYVNNKSGDGGNAGAGAIINCSSTSTVYAYNGDMITDDNYDNVYLYDKDGNVTTQLLTTIQKLDGTTIIPTYIFAQSGTIRETYTTNLTQSELDKIQIISSNTYTINSTTAESTSILATEETATSTTGYTNGYMDNQGIGSGAGYLEKDNGTYTIDSSMN